MESLMNMADRACADADWMEAKMGAQHPACRRQRLKARALVGAAWLAIIVQAAAVLAVGWALAVVALVW